eukprot:3350559-Amphidinium_carterae.2
MVYMDDLPLIGPNNGIQNFVKTVAEVLQLKHVTKLHRDTPLIVTGGQIEYYNNYIAMSVAKEYYDDNLLALYNMQPNTTPLATTGVLKTHLQKLDYL